MLQLYSNNFGLKLFSTAKKCMHCYVFLSDECLFTGLPLTTLYIISIVDLQLFNLWVPGILDSEPSTCSCSYYCADTCNNIPTTKPTHETLIPLSGFYFAIHHYYKMDGWIQGLALRWVLATQMYLWLRENQVEHFPLATWILIEQCSSLDNDPMSKCDVAFELYRISIVLK